MEPSSETTRSEIQSAESGAPAQSDAFNSDVSDVNLRSNYQYIEYFSSQVLGIRNTLDFSVFNFEHLYMYERVCGLHPHINMKWIIICTL